jgi:microcompartment protein CcmK/EutM
MSAQMARDKSANEFAITPEMVVVGSSALSVRGRPRIPVDHAVIVQRI